jgi:hypothetical protein
MTLENYAIINTLRNPEVRKIFPLDVGKEYERSANT